MPTNTHPLPVSQPRFGRPERTEIRANFARDVLADMTAAYLADDRPWVVGFSGGKDSTALVQLLYYMLARLRAATESDHHPTAQTAHNHRPTGQTAYDHRPTDQTAQHNRPTGQIAQHHRPTDQTPWDRRPAGQTARPTGQPPLKRKPVYVLASDTRVEAPYISTRIRTELATIQAAAERDGLPISTHLVFPKLNDTFWANLIGRGYPSPNTQFRWCTDRLHQLDLN